MTSKELVKRSQPFADSFYSMHADTELAEFGMSTTLALPFRLYMLGMSRINKWGHAPFHRGEMLSLLGCARQRIKPTINSLISAKILSPQSTRLCLVYTSRLVRRTDRSEVRCTEPDHLGRQERMWVHGLGWERSEGDWQATLNDPAERAGLITEVIRTRTTTDTETVRVVSHPSA